LFELLKIARKQTKNPHSFCYFHQKDIGVWQFILQDKTLLFHHFTVEKKGFSLKDTLKIGQQYLVQQGLKESCPMLDLHPFLEDSPSPHSENLSFLSFNTSKSNIRLRLLKFPSHLMMTLALLALLAMIIIYNKISIFAWENQVNRSRNVLEKITKKMTTPSYQNLLQEFERHQNTAK
jgi:hypothetical protein